MRYGDWVTVGGTGLVGGEEEVLGRDRIARSGEDSIGIVAADREAGADYAGHTESRGGSNKLVTVRPGSWPITWMKSGNEIIE